MQDKGVEREKYMHEQGNKKHAVTKVHKDR